MKNKKKDAHRGCVFSLLFGAHIGVCVSAYGVHSSTVGGRDLNVHLFAVSSASRDIIVWYCTCCTEDKSSLGTLPNKLESVKVLDEIFET